MIALESLFMKNLPREVRGAMTITLTFFMGVSALVFNLVGGPVHDSMGPAAPFLLVSIFDALFCIFAIILGLTGHLSAPKTEKEKEEEDKGALQHQQEES